MKLTPRIIKQRKAIANDVLLQIAAAAYHPVTGVYVSQGWVVGAPALDDDDVTGELQRFIKARVGPSKPCSVCALGSAFLSAVRLYDNCQVKNGTFALSIIRRKLLEFFSVRELSVLEACYEQSPGFIGRDMKGSLPDTLPRWAKKAREEWSDSPQRQAFFDELFTKDRLKFLMQAVVELAGQEITLSRVTTFAMQQLAINPAYSSVRSALGW